MSSKREEERNEKIIRGLLKLPPNRRCINCNSLGPQYVCTNFWTFICTTCSGIHREFTHRVKSVSMAKFTFQEVDALQKGGNQRARELFLKGWDPQRNRVPDNSNVEKVREFIKSVYVDKVYSKETSSDRPPRDPQSLRSHEDEMRRASSYHSYSQSPPYDFQYEERQYGKHAPVLTRKPGSDRGLYEGKLASFLSPTHLSDDGFANEGSHPRASDYSASGGGTPFRSDVLSPVSRGDFGSPSSENSRNTSEEVPQLQTMTHISGANRGTILHPQRTMSTGSFESGNSTSFKSTEHPLPEVGSNPDKIHLEKSVSLPSLPQSSTSPTFDGLDLFSTPFSQNADIAPQTGSNSQLPSELLAQSVNIELQPPVSSISSFTEQKPSQISQPPLDLFAALSQQQPSASFNENASDVVAPDTGGWATFDIPKNPMPMGTDKSAPPPLPSSDEDILAKMNPFTFTTSLHQNSSERESSAPTMTNAFGHDCLQNVEAAVNHTELWSAFGNSTGERFIQNFAQNNEQPETNKYLGFGAHQAKGSDNYLRTTNETGPNDFPVASAVADTYPFATALKPSNPFDIPFDSDVDSGNKFNSQVWNVSSLQGALPTGQIPAASHIGVHESWFPETSIPLYTSVPGGVSFDSTTGSLGFMAGQAPYAQIPNMHGQGPVASSISRNPFA
ncbi:probable ADP-ribosylation factor GTPase-activating protein AGD14 isoform X2 [Andrographis paniculata]|uniref:probable ADP-ribosylation factor GTPase-activating protein AGD14 isoform X2 n=1 Tax=Andrographis paniculata TaxID=175694 RepID=UPI0021E7A694|nr:probable ADP-ribosylation factor GTPase-activating protein AGD14 isoform X2 [Andrographis paniculata]